MNRLGIKNAHLTVRHLYPERRPAWRIYVCWTMLRCAGSMGIVLK